MPDTRTVMFDGKPNVFPADFTDAEISSALGAIPASNSAASPKAKTWTDRAVDALPAIGGTIGGVAGGISGAAAGGIGAIPGSAAGAGLGGAAGEAARQLVERARGNAAPGTMTDAAAEIGKQGAIMGAVDLAGGGLAAGAKAVAPTVVKGAAAAADTLSPDLVGLVSPRVAHGLRIAQQAIAVAEKNLPANAPKMAIDAKKFIQIKALTDVGIPQGEAVKTIMNLSVKGLLQ